MKHLKRFESLFGPPKPEMISYEDFYTQKTSREAFTEDELLYLESIFDINRKKIYDIEYLKRATFIYNKFTSDKEELPDNFVICLYSNSQNGEFITFECYKHEDDWYYICISQESDTYDDEQISGFTEYYRCSEFDSLEILLNKWL